MQYAKLFSDLSNNILPILRYFSSHLEKQIPYQSEDLFPIILKIVHTGQYLEIAERHNPIRNDNTNPINDALYRFGLSASLINLNDLHKQIKKLNENLINSN